MKLYENVVIGNFLYGLGFAVRAKSKSGIVPSVVNLLQQTPADKELADVLLDFPGVVRLIEFKSLENKSPKEHTKHLQLTAAIGRDESRIKLSKSIHWFVETAVTEQTLISRIVPYLEAYPGENSQHSLEGFIETIAEDAVNKESMFSREELRDYLSLVARCQGSGSISTGGLLLVANASGALRFVELTNMMELRLQHREFVNELHQAIERELQQELAREKSRSRSLGRDLER